jgi:hypothetical protein
MALRCLLLLLLDGRLEPRRVPRDVNGVSVRRGEAQPSRKTIGPSDRKHPGARLPSSLPLKRELDPLIPVGTAVSNQGPLLLVEVHWHTEGHLASLLRDGLEDCEGALALFDVVLSTKIKQGCDEYEIVLARSNRAITLDHLGRGTEARPEFEAVFAGRKRLLGPRHPHTMKTQDALAMLLHDQLGEKEEGLRLMREVVEVFQTVLGKEHKWTKNAKESLEAWESGQTTGRKS